MVWKLVSPKGAVDVVQFVGVHAPTIAPATTTATTLWPATQAVHHGLAHAQASRDIHGGVPVEAHRTLLGAAVHVTVSSAVVTISSAVATVSSTVASISTSVSYERSA
jgi:hypothetical protein